MDQGATPFMTAEAPLMCNQLYVMDDMSAENGGTLVVPMSHKVTSVAGSGKPVGQLPPAINLEAPAGTVLIFEGRLLHGAGRPAGTAATSRVISQQVELMSRFSTKPMISHFSTFESLG
jgi:ectoine hydroxylase-related dioxygenase (phytanoyl-CoA dioxygenase family)